MNYGKMFDTINEIHDKSGKNKIGIFFDIIHCGIKYQTGYMDYKLFEMYDIYRNIRLLLQNINRILLIFFYEKTMSFRASAHAGVGIPILRRRLPHQFENWFAMTANLMTLRFPRRLLSV